MKVEFRYWFRTKYIGLNPLLSIGWDRGSVRVYFEWFNFVMCIFYWRKDVR